MKEIKLNNERIKKKTQKGKLSLFKRKGYFLNNYDFSLFIKNSKLITLDQLNSLNKSINLHIPKEIIKLYALPLLMSRVKRSGTRMGKGKGKISYYVYKFPLSKNLLRLRLDIIEDYDINSKLQRINLYMKTLEGLKKIIKKYPFLGIKERLTI